LEVQSEEKVRSTKLEVQSEEKVPSTKLEVQSEEKVRSTKLEVLSEEKVPSTKLEVQSEEKVQSTKLEVQSEEKVRSTKLEVRSEEPKTEEVPISVLHVEEPKNENRTPATAVALSAVEGQQPKVSTMSLSSIRAKKELAESLKSVVKEVVHLPNEPFTETQMHEQWFEYAQRLENKGQHIVASLITINKPTLDGTVIIHELPNESSKIDFEKDKDFLGYLRGKLHNHDITIHVRVNETLVVKKSNNPMDKYNRLLELNPNLEVLKKIFDLDF